MFSKKAKGTKDRSEMVSKAFFLYMKINENSKIKAKEKKVTYRYFGTNIM